MARLLVHVEGLTEEAFVREMLRDHLLASGFSDVGVRIMGNARLRLRRGGIRPWPSARKDIINHLKEDTGCIATTMVDYYGLPADFPGMDSRPPHGTPLQRVTHIENALAQHFGSPANFVPFLALHEFEAWLFSSTAELPRALSESLKQKEFEAIRASVATPEEINERPELAPSKRIVNLFPAYRKALHGPITAQRIGLKQIRSECPHFNDWMTKLEVFSTS